MKKFFTLGFTFVLLGITVVNMTAQDSLHPWHLITYENGEEVAFYNIEVITGIKATEQSVTVVLDSEKVFPHPVTTTMFGFDTRKAGTGTPNEIIATLPWTVRYANGRLYFNTVVNGIAIYTATGVLMARFNGSYSETPMNLPTGIYVIQTGGNSAKLHVGNDNGSAASLTGIEKKTADNTPVPVRLLADEVIKAYWNITAGNSITSIDISSVERFYFTSDNSIIFTMKDGNTIEITDYQRGEFSVNPVDDQEDTPTAEPINLTVRQLAKVNADNRFAFKMFGEVSAMKGANTFFSPLSLNMALGMLYNGASGDTRSEMAETLGMAGFSDAEINEYYRKMSQALLNIDPLTDIGIANSIWYR